VQNIPERYRVPCGYGGKISIGYTQMKNKDNVALIYLRIRVLWLGTPAPFGVDQIYMSGTVQDSRTSGDVNRVTCLVKYLVLKGVKASGFNVSGWSLSQGTPRHPQLSSWIPHSFFPFPAFLF
jgi:hypothetical protein